jgi:hypothetical protein
MSREATLLVPPTAQVEAVARSARIFARKVYGFDPPYPECLIPALARIRDRQGRLCPLRANRAQRKYARRRSSRNIILKARQTGITTYIAARYFMETITRPGTVSLQIAHSLESAQQIFRIVYRLLHGLGPADHSYLKIIRANVRELAFAKLDSRYIVDTAGNRNAGRGLTVHNLHASEVALWPGDPQETMAALLAAVPPGGQVDLESTPHGAAGYFYNEWQRARAGQGFTPHFFPWCYEDAYRTALLPGESLEPLAPDEILLRERYRLSLQHIKFRRHLRAQFSGLAPQEFAENDVDCFLRSGRPVFEISAIEDRLRKIPEPLRVSENGAELVWFEPEAGRTYLIGADVAEGKERGDFSAAVVVDQQQGLQCAEWLAQRVPHEFARALDRLGRRYNNAVVAVERNNHGHAVLEALQHSFRYPRIYHYPPALGSHGIRQPGWPTNALTRPQAISALDAMLRDAPETFMSRRLLEQCRAYSHTDTGSTAAPPGAHDDLVMAAAIAHAIRQTHPSPCILSLER